MCVTVGKDGDGTEQTWKRPNVVVSLDTWTGRSIPRRVELYIGKGTFGLIDHSRAGVEGSVGGRPDVCVNKNGVV